MVSHGKPNLIRQFNRDLIKDLIVNNGPITKVEIARISGASVPTVNKIVNELESDGIICRSVDERGGLGRKAAAYVINRDAGYYIVFFIQNEAIRAALADNFGEVLREETFHPDMDSREEVDAAIFSAADSFCAGIPDGRLNAIGLGVPGVIGRDGKISTIPTVPCWEGTDPVSAIEARYHVPVFIENDVKLMTVGVYNSECSDRCRNMVFLYMFRGLGAGIVINGRLYKGFSNFAGEYGFMLPDFENTGRHPNWTGDLEVRLRPLAEKKIAGSGLSPEESMALIGIISGAVVNFVSVLNPELILICAPNITDGEFASIRESVAERIPDVCQPELELISEEKHGLSGVIDLCMAGTTSKISLVSETGLQL